jgi:integrase
MRINLERKILDESIFGKAAVATFADAVVSYLEVKQCSDDTKRIVQRLLEYFKNTRLANINQVAIDRACKAFVRPDSGPGTKMRNVIVPMNAILEHAARRGMCARPLFEKLPSPPSKTPYLLPNQATALVRAAPRHLWALLIFMLGVGCRPSEALGLDWPNVDLKGAQATLTLGKVRGVEIVVQLQPVVVMALMTLPHREGRAFRVSLPRATDGNVDEIGEGYGKNGVNSGNFRSAWHGAAERAGLAGKWREWAGKDGRNHRAFLSDFTPYCLRHTYASWHYCVHKDLQMLRDDIGWTTTRMAERYGKRMSGAHRQDIIDWWEGKVSLDPNEHG